MRLKARHKQEAMVPTASMADIAFLLIVFFMVTITFETDKAQVVLPRTELRFEVPRESAYISITDQLQIRVTSGEEMSVPVGPDDIVSFAANVVAMDPTRAFVLKADKQVPYREIDRVIDQLKQAKVEVIYLLSEQKTIIGADGAASPGG